MAAYYNEIDPRNAQWLRNLIAAKKIADGIVDERSITDVRAEDIEGFEQVHFFAGIGGWSLALRLAGWPDDAPVWTGSCPCQPFSVAGKKQGTKDERHLWPQMFRLISECQPSTIFGEQTESPLAREWLDRVFADLEKSRYAAAGATLPAACVNAPHRRHRIWWVADRCETKRNRRGKSKRKNGGSLHAANCGENNQRLGNDNSIERRLPNEERSQVPQITGATQDDNGMGNCVCSRLERFAGTGNNGSVPRQPLGAANFWNRFDIAVCNEKGIIKYRRIESGTLPLAHGLPRSVGPDSTRAQRMELKAAQTNRQARIKGYGNAIVPQVAAEFIGAFLETKS